VDLINNAIFFLINAIHDVVGSYGWSIVIITVLIRVLLWPTNTAQTKSMRKMQELQPKLKELQARHKDNPQKLQEAMMKFYAENKFNPMAGCLPMIIQLPIFIGLFGALNSPQFLAESVHENFFFVDKLYNTLHSHAGEPLDGQFSVEDKDTFMTGKTATLVMKDGQTREMPVKDINKAITVSPKPLFPGSPMQVTLNLEQLGIEDVGYYADRLASARTYLIGNQTRELEEVTFENVKGKLVTSLKTLPGQTRWHWDVLVLIGFYAILTLLYQRVMSPAKPAPAAGTDDQAAMQQKMMKLMPLMFVVILFFIPIPAGVMIYLVVTTALMFIQTAWVNWSEKKAEDASVPKPSRQIVDVKAE